MESDHWAPDGAAALAYCRAVEGTPYGGNRRETGKAIDCINLVMATLEAAGIAANLSTAPHPITVGPGNNENPMAEALARIFHATRIPTDRWEPQDCDVVIFGVGRWAFHCGVIAGGRLWHVTTQMPVHHCAIDGHRRRFQEIIRIHQPGIKINPETINLA
jgi:hypothetical protein